MLRSKWFVDKVGSLEKKLLSINLQVAVTCSVRKFSPRIRTFVLYTIYTVINSMSLQLRFNFHNSPSFKWNKINFCFFIVQNGWTSLRAVLSNFQLSSFGREKMKFLKLSQIFQFNSIRIVALGRPSWFCPSGRAFSGYFRVHFNNLPGKENVKNPAKKPLFEESKCCLICWQAVLVIRSTSDF